MNSTVQAKEEALILSLETATRAGSVALTRGAKLLSSRTGDANSSHSAHLLTQIDEILKEAGCAINDVDFFAAALGPGSFTGLRIGLATAKSLAATLDKLCAGVQTLHAVAHSAGASNSTLALLQAGRGELFAQLLAVDESGAVRELNEPRHLPPAQVLAMVRERIELTLAGEGVPFFLQAVGASLAETGIEIAVGVVEKRETLRTYEGRHVVWRVGATAARLAVDVAALAYMSVREGKACGTEELRAIYVRASDAELKV